MVAHPVTKRIRGPFIFAVILLAAGVFIHYVLQMGVKIPTDTPRTGVITEIDPPRFRISKVTSSVLVKDDADDQTTFVIHPRGRMDGCTRGDKIQFVFEGSRAIYVPNSCVKKSVQ